jgi:uncharacterized protein
MAGHKEYLINAVLDGDLSLVVRLLGEGADVEEVDRGGRTALHYAASRGFLDIATLLIETDADVNAADNAGWTALHAAADASHQELVRLLLDRGAEVDAQDQNGNSPLSNAVYRSDGRGEIIRLLLSHGADRNLKNRYGVSPLSLAETIASVNVKGFFEDQGGDTDESTGGDDGVTEERAMQIPAPPLVEYPNDQHRTVLEAITAAMEKLDRMDMGGRWISFSGQGEGPREETYQIENVLFSGRTFDLGEEKVNVPAVMRFAKLDPSKVKVVSSGDGKITLSDSTPAERARFLDAVFRKHFKLRPFEGETDYAMGAEW